MPVPLLAAAGSLLAKEGIDLLGKIFKGAASMGVEKITEKIKEKTGIDIGQIEGELNPEQVKALREFEIENQKMLLEHIERLMEIEVQEKQLHQQDRESARGTLKTALSQGDIFSKRFVYIYATAITALTFIYIFGVTFFEIPESNIRIVDTTLGFLLGVSLSAIVQFFFGSSQGSSDKQEKINDLYDSMGKKG